VAIQIFINLEDLIWWIVFGGIMAILLIVWIALTIVEGIGAFFYGKRKREKMYEEYERKYGDTADDAQNAQE